MSTCTTQNTYVLSTQAEYDSAIAEVDDFISNNPGSTKEVDAQNLTITLIYPEVTI